MTKKRGSSTDPIDLCESPPPQSTTKPPKECSKTTKSKYDPPHALKKKIETFVSWMKGAKRPSFLLGAGLSAPVLPTFRGKGGLWTRGAGATSSSTSTSATSLSTPLPQSTAAHHALVSLEKLGKVHHASTQNYDDLSFCSGFPPWKLSKLHGNIYTECCGKCDKLYKRDFEVELATSKDHEIGRFYTVSS